MSTVEANQFEQTIQLSYRSAPNPVYVDPVAENLAIAGTIFILLAWLLYGGLDYAQGRNVILCASLCLAVIGSFCTVGAVLDRHVPWVAWLAVACVLAYWLMVAGAAVMSVIRICTTIPQFGYPIP
ncbi:MAG TPA: hypothetical protein VGP94_03780 [Tepidisphaeraceae bacterium]|jgi:hypothetical protein|nr:hypothetical protein [Tepidisphaeraceae bacterium]